MTIQQFAADMRALPANTRVLINANFDTEDNHTREYLLRASELTALFATTPAGTLRVRVVNATPYLRVRDAAKTGAKVGELHNGDVVTVWEAQTVKDWYQISAGEYAGKWISAGYVEKVT